MIQLLEEAKVLYKEVTGKELFKTTAKKRNDKKEE